ncbi:MAG: thymidine phosphorylase [Calditrichaceae bacterium]
MTAYEIISRKRDGGELTDQEISYMIDGYTRGDIPDYQVAAWLMAIFLQGMNTRETLAITNTMLHSGESADLTQVPGIKVDKHSTGGVGDKVSIILAPIVAAAGVPVPMISGRGLGHTGGTLDKLQSIPGFRVDYSIDEYREKIKKTGVCLIGQTASLAPADKKIYALRDVTATIQSIPLISASIMSKKLAEGIDALVLDVKTGNGAFMQSYEKSVELAKSLIAIGERAGKPTVAYITNMNEPLGNTVGNWLEMVECFECMQGEGPDDLMEVTHYLSGTMIYLGKKAESIEEGMKISREMIKSGKAWEKFLEIVAEQNGDVSYVKKPEMYPKAKFQSDVLAGNTGFISGINALEVGLTAITLGAGREKSEDIIDPKAGIILNRKTGDKVIKGDKLMTVYTDKEHVVQSAVERLSAAVSCSDTPVSREKMILDYLDKKNL